MPDITVWLLLGMTLDLVRNIIHAVLLIRNPLLYEKGTETNEPDSLTRRDFLNSPPPASAGYAWLLRYAVISAPQEYWQANKKD